MDGLFVAPADDAVSFPVAKDLSGFNLFWPVMNGDPVGNLFLSGFPAVPLASFGSPSSQVLPKLQGFIRLFVDEPVDRFMADDRFTTVLALEPTGNDLW